LLLNTYTCICPKQHYVIKYVSDLRQVGDFHREKLKDTKWVIRSRTSKDRIQWRKGKTKIYKTKDWATRTPLKIGVELMFSCREIYGLGYQHYFSYTVSVNVISGENIVFCPLMYGFLLPIWYLLTFLQYIYRDGFINW
jgi:hypothetical protein